eukprot:794398-Amphidinium_carterae.1
MSSIVFPSRSRHYRALHHNAMGSNDNELLTDWSGMVLKRPNRSVKFALHFEGALQVMQGVRSFLISTNGFKGTLPEGGIRSMSAVT